MRSRWAHDTRREFPSGAGRAGTCKKSALSTFRCKAPRWPPEMANVERAMRKRAWHAPTPLMLRSARQARVSKHARRRSKPLQDGCASFETRSFGPLLRMREGVHGMHEPTRQIGQSRAQSLTEKEAKELNDPQPRHAEALSRAKARESLEARMMPLSSTFWTILRGSAAPRPRTSG